MPHDFVVLNVLLKFGEGLTYRPRLATIIAAIAVF